MTTDKPEYVKHPTIPWEELDGKILCKVGKDGTERFFKLKVEDVQPDGSYILLATETLERGRTESLTA